MPSTLHKQIVKDHWDQGPGAANKRRNSSKSKSAFGLKGSHPVFAGQAMQSKAIHIQLKGTLPLSESPTGSGFYAFWCWRQAKLESRLKRKAKLWASCRAVTLLRLPCSLSRQARSIRIIVFHSSHIQPIFKEFFHSLDRPRPAPSSSVKHEDFAG